MATAAVDTAADWLVFRFQTVGESQLHRVALGWVERGFVEWTCPSLDGATKLPPDAAHCGDMIDCGLEDQPSFLRAMNWLDAVCFGAATLEEVRRTCETNPDYGLRCSFEAELAPVEAGDAPSNAAQVGVKAFGHIEHMPVEGVPVAVQVNVRQNERTLRFGDADIQSAMDLRDPDRLVLDYTRLMMGFQLFVPHPARMLMIGLGGGSLPKFCHRHLPNADITVVEINPDVIAMRDLFEVPPDQPAFRVVEADGADFVADADDGHFDVIVVDGFHAERMPSSLGSQDFYSHCERVLRRGGVMVCNLHELDQHLGIYRSRIASVFGDSVVAVLTRECDNSVVFARKGLSPSARLPRHLQRPDGMSACAWSGIESDLYDVLCRARIAGHAD